MSVTPETFDSLAQTSWYEHDVLAGAAVGVVGVGGIGAPGAVQLARLGVGRLLLLDPDICEPSNLSRTFVRSDVGKYKVHAVRDEIARCGLGTEVLAFAGDVEYDLSWGMVSQLDVLVGALDSRAARVGLNKAAWRAGVPVVDAAQDGETLTALARVILPSAAGACYQCTLSAADYEHIGRHVPCTREDPEAPRLPTTGLEAGVAAALLASLTARVLLEGPEAVAGTEYRIGLRDHSFITTQLQRNSACRFDHRTWPGDAPILAAPAPVARMTLAEVADFLRAELGEGFSLHLDRDAVTDLACPECDHINPGLMALRGGIVRCQGCGEAIPPPPTALLNTFSEDKLRDPEFAQRTFERVLPEAHVAWACRDGNCTMLSFGFEEGSPW